MDSTKYAKEKATELKEKRKAKELKSYSVTVENARREARTAHAKRVQDRCNQGTNRSHPNDVKTNNVNFQVTIVLNNK
jgi:hypothetical protein